MKSDRFHRIQMMSAGVTAITVLSPVASAQEGGSDEAAVHRTEVDFEGLTVTGDVVGPQVQLVSERPAMKGRSLIRLRENFDEEIGATAKAYDAVDPPTEGMVRVPEHRPEQIVAEETEDEEKREDDEGSRKARSVPEEDCAQAVVVTDDGNTYTGWYVLKSPEVIVFETCEGDRVTIQPTTIKKAVDLNAASSTSAQPQVVVVPAPAAPAPAPAPSPAPERASRGGHGCLTAIGVATLVVSALVCAGALL